MASSFLLQSSLFPENLHLRYAFKRHRSKVLHYDLRLELGGVLLSWMLLDPPSLDPREDRLAIERPLHNPRYLLNEFVVPTGRAGAGPTIVWEKGLWRPQMDCHILTEFEVVKCLQRGVIEFDLSGSRLNGKFLLAHSHADKWFLRKLDDEHCERPAN